MVKNKITRFPLQYLMTDPLVRRRPNGKGKMHTNELYSSVYWRIAVIVLDISILTFVFRELKFYLEKNSFRPINWMCEFCCSSIMHRILRNLPDPTLHWYEMLCIHKPSQYVRRCFWNHFPDVDKYEKWKQVSVPNVVIKRTSSQDWELNLRIT